MFYLLDILLFCLVFFCIGISNVDSVKGKKKIFFGSMKDFEYNDSDAISAFDKLSKFSPLICDRNSVIIMLENNLNIGKYVSLLNLLNVFENEIKLRLTQRELSAVIISFNCLESNTPNATLIDTDSQHPSLTGNLGNCINFQVFLTSLKRFVEKIRFDDKEKNKYVIEIID